VYDVRQRSGVDEGRRRGIADYADLVVMPTLVLDRLRGKGMRGIVSA
jgi:hypothetical protein